MVPIIFLTAFYNDDQHVLEGYGTGAVDYMQKPVNPAILRSKVAVFAELYRKNLESTLANRALLGEITVRLQAEEHLKELNQDLEQRVKERSEALESLRRSEQVQKVLLDQSRAMEERLRHLSQQLIRVQEDERKRISRELHDVNRPDIGGHQPAPGLADSITDGKSKDLGAKIAQTQQLVAKSVDIIHRFARDLRPSTLDDVGLIPTLHTYLKDFAQQTGVRVEMTACATVEQLEAVRRTVLYRVAQEALANVARHAKASSVQVNISDGDERIYMEIKDNGQGFVVNGHPGAKKNDRPWNSRHEGTRRNDRRSLRHRIRSRIVDHRACRAGHDWVTKSGGLRSKSGTPHPKKVQIVSPPLDQPINILIVDDEPKNLTVLETVLDDTSYRLVRANSADQALLALVVDEFALIILDIRMPGMTGLELAQTIKERKKTAHVPILFLTAYYNEDRARPSWLRQRGGGLHPKTGESGHPCAQRWPFSQNCTARTGKTPWHNRALLSEVDGSA